jgi:hypothetical protein
MKNELELNMAVFIAVAAILVVALFAWLQVAG